MLSELYALPSLCLLPASHSPSAWSSVWLHRSQMLWGNLVQGDGCRLNPRQQGWLATHSPFAQHLPSSTHCEISLLTKAQGKQLVGDTPRRSCLFSSSQGWYAWLSHPTTEHTGCPQCPEAGGRVGPSSSLRLCFLTSREKRGCLWQPLPWLCPEPCPVNQNHHSRLFLSLSHLGVRDPNSRPSFL